MKSVWKKMKKKISKTEFLYCALCGNGTLHEYVVGLDALLLHATGRNVNAIVFAHAYAAARTRHPAQMVHLLQQFGNQLRRLFVLHFILIKKIEFRDSEFRFP